MTMQTPEITSSSPTPPEGGAASGAESARPEDDHHQDPTRTPYQILRSAEDREDYLHLTDNLIRQMIEEETEVAIFLDKSARPVAWMVNTFWDQLAPRKPDGSLYPKPAIKFLNIDREQWGAIVGRTEGGMVDVSAIPEDRITELKKVMSPAETSAGHTEEGPAPQNTYLTGKKVMVIDEIAVSRDTLHISQRILKQAFPDAAAVVPVAWMDGMPQVDPRSGQRINTKNPVWYNDTKITGRGVANRDTTKALASDITVSRIGRYWLSTTFKEPDTEGIQLRREVEQMARDLSEHRLFYRPSSWKPTIDPIDERIRRIDGITPDQFKSIKATSRLPEERVKRLGQLISQNSAHPAK